MASALGFDRLFDYLWGVFVSPSNHFSVMAVVISPYVGDARGKLGEGVFMRSKGQTIVRGYNPSPLNRRTVSQQVQRAQFSAAVKFFSRGVQNLFQFAFETKPTKESDYNAFMRLNAKKGIYFGPAENANDAFPALAPWAMTRGSLKGASVDFDQLPRVYFSGIDSVPARTIAALSQAIIASDSNYEVGDILTFVNIDMMYPAGTPSYPFDTVPELAPIWSLYQIILDTSDTSALPADTWFMQIDTDYGLGIWPKQSDVLTAYAGGCCFVHSRVRNGKVYVSDSNLDLNNQATLAYNYGRSDTWRRVVMAAWGTEAESILQGSVAARQRVIATELILTFNPPIDSGNITLSDTITITGTHTLSDIATHLVVRNADNDDYEVVVDGDRLTMIPPGQTASSSLAWSYADRGDASVLTFAGAPSGFVVQSIGWQD